MTVTSSTLAKGLRLLHAIAADQGRSSLSDIAARQHLPLATAHRLAITLRDEGFLSQIGRGHFMPGPALERLPRTENAMAAMAAQFRTPLARLAERYSICTHFGYLENGMVTYMVKENGTGQSLHTIESGQQEAYCSAIGKVLLAALPEDELDEYLSDGPFIALTPRTITRPDELRQEIAQVRRDGIAFDRQEIRDDLFCMAMPVRGQDENVIAGISLSFLSGPPEPELRTRLRRALKRISSTRSVGLN